MALERMARKTGRLDLQFKTAHKPPPMSSYELLASVTDPIVGSHVDGTIFRTLCVDLDRHLLNIDEHSGNRVRREGRVAKLAHPLEYKKSIGPLGKMLFLFINIG